jgi:predicted MFS family arabinose efflux permease
MMLGLIFYGSNVSILSRWILTRTRWDPRKALVGSSLLLLPVCFSLSLPNSVTIFIFVMSLYQMLNAACAVYQNHLKLEFASKEKTSIDLAVFKTLSNIVKPFAVLIAGALADRMGFNWVFYFSSFLVLLSSLTSFVLSKAARRSSAVLMGSFGSEVAALKK